MPGTSNEFETLEVVFRPARLCFDDALESLSFENITPAVRRDSNAAAIGMPISLVRSHLTNEIEAITRKRGDKISGGERAQAAVVDRHALR